MKTFDKR